MTHDVALGGYYAHIDEPFRRYSATTLQDVSGNSRLLDLVAVNAAGPVVGSADPERRVAATRSEFANGSGSQDTIAVYASDEWQITPPTAPRRRQLRYEKRHDHAARRGEHQDGQPRRCGDPGRRQCADRQWCVRCRSIAISTMSATPSAPTGSSADRPGVFARYTSHVPPAQRRQLHHQRHGAAGDPEHPADGGRVQALHPAGQPLPRPASSPTSTAMASATSSFDSEERRLYPADHLYRHPLLWRRDGRRRSGRSTGSTSRSMRRCRSPSSATCALPSFPPGAPVQRDYTGNQLLRVPEIWRCARRRR